MKLTTTKGVSPARNKKHLVVPMLQEMAKSQCSMPDLKYFAVILDISCSIILHVYVTCMVRLFFLPHELIVTCGGMSKESLLLTSK